MIRYLVFAHLPNSLSQHAPLLAPDKITYHWNPIELTWCFKDPIARARRSNKSKRTFVITFLKQSKNIKMMIILRHVDCNH